LEPLTHFLTGACLARAGFNRKTALATATMTLAAEAPDLDVALAWARRLAQASTLPIEVRPVRDGAKP